MSVFDRITRTIGDLGSPFYAEERQRDVWNEASAVGLQVTLWSALVVAFAMSWFGAPAVVPWAVAVLAIVGASSWTVLLMVRRAGLTGWEDAPGGRQFRPRIAAFAVLYLGTVLGLLLRVPDRDGFVGGMRIGAGIGVVLAVVALLLGAWSARRRASREALDDGDPTDPAEGVTG
jgi:DNA segregation ATPase FtsK/SpoIIIE-like protein